MRVVLFLLEYKEEQKIYKCGPFIVFHFAELQKIIDAKTNELAKKTEELKARSAQPQRRE